MMPSADSKSVTVVLLFLICATTNSYQISATGASTVTEQSRFEWSRAKRVVIHDDSRRARYPSITSTSNGFLLVLFTRQSAEQEPIGRADLVLVRSTDKGDSWSPPQVVFEGRLGETRANGTLTTLSSGRIMAPFTELVEQQTKSQVRLLSSEDGGISWQIDDIHPRLPLVWWTPCGKLIEQADGTLVMPVFGAPSESHLKATIHSCGLLRSLDGGKTWGDFSWIARGPTTVIGAAADRQFSFEGLSVVALPERDGDGQWLAMVAARRLNQVGDGPTITNEGPGAPLVLCRLWSNDQGQTWTPPDQVTVGAWPAIATIGRDTVCANTVWAAWGQMHLYVSQDGFRTFNQKVRMTTRGWLRGRANNPREMPLAPTVPYLADQWQWDHFGFPSALPLDEDNLIVVFNRPQRGEAQVEGRPNQNIPYEQERIQGVFYRRSRIDEPLALPPPSNPKRRHGRWVLAERITVPHIDGSMAQASNGDIIAARNGQLDRSSDGGRSWLRIESARLPDGAISALGMLRNGRWLAVTIKVDQEWQGGRHVPMGEVGGYPTFKIEGESYDCSMIAWRSDDEGKTWTASQPFKGPFKWALPTVSHFIESPDGTVSLPIFGCVTDEEMSSYSSSNGVIRSTNGGESWGDFSFVFRTNPKGPDDFQPEPRYSEMDISELPNGHWVAICRTEYIFMGPTGWGNPQAAVSTDHGLHLASDRRDPRQCRPTETSGIARRWNSDHAQKPLMAAAGCDHDLRRRPSLFVRVGRSVRNGECIHARRR